MVLDIKRRNLGQDVRYIFHHWLGFRGGRGESCVSVSEKWESQKGYKEVKRSDLIRVSTSFLSSFFCPLLLFVVFQAEHLKPRAEIQLNKKMTTAFGCLRLDDCSHADDDTNSSFDDKMEGDDWDGTTGRTGESQELQSSSRMSRAVMLV